MGQKTHPKALRLVTSQTHLSEWYSKKSQYSEFIEEDYQIRETISKTFEDLFPLSRVEIQRLFPQNAEKHTVNVTIFSLFPRAKEFARKLTKYFDPTLDPLNSKVLAILSNSKGNLKKIALFFIKKKIRELVRRFQIETKKDFYIELKFIKNPFEDSVLIAKYIGEQLQKRTPFRRAMKQTIKKVQKTSLKGIKIEVSGRLNGVEIARSEWKREGRVPLHTLKAKIDYTHYGVQTIYGVIGIKVWLFSGEKES